jgi:hypothetical protein
LTSTSPCSTARSLSICVVICWCTLCNPDLDRRAVVALADTSSGAAFAGERPVRPMRCRRRGCMRSFGTSRPVGASRGSVRMRWLQDSS